MFDTAGVVDDETGSVTGSGSGSAGLDGLGVVGELIARAAVADAGVVVDDDLVASAVRLGMIRRFLDATEAHVLAELDARGTTVVTEGATTAAWYAQHSGVATAIAAKRVRVATKLRDPLCAVDAALSRGRISWDHAAVIFAVANPRIIDDIASIQDLLIDLAHGATFERYAADIRAIAERIDVDGGHNPRDDDSTNELHFDVLPGGTLIGGTLVGDIEQSIITAVEAETDRLHRELSAEHETTRGAVEIPKRSTLRAMALAELCRAGRAADPSTSVAPVPDVTLVIHADDPFAAVTQQGQRLAVGCRGAVLRPGDPHAARRLTRRTPRSRPPGPLRQPEPTPRAAPTRRRLRVPRMWRPPQLDRRPPHQPVETRRHRRTNRHGQHGALVPQTPPRRAPPRLDDDRPTQRLVHHHHPHRHHPALPTTPTSRTSPTRMKPSVPPTRTPISLARGTRYRSFGATKAVAPARDEEWSCLTSIFHPGCPESAGR